MVSGYSSACSMQNSEAVARHSDNKASRLAYVCSRLSTAHRPEVLKNLSELVCTSPVPVGVKIWLTRAQINAEAQSLSLSMHRVPVYQRSQHPGVDAEGKISRAGFYR